MEKRTNYIRLCLRDSEKALIDRASELMGEHAAVWVRDMAIKKARREMNVQFKASVPDVIAPSTEQESEWKS